MAKYPYKLFLCSALIFLSHQFIEPYYPHPIVDSYLDDIVFMPIVLGLILIGMRLIWGYPLQLNNKMLLIAFILTVLHAEVLFPALSDKFTADPLDALAYGTGILIFKYWGYR